MLEFNREAVMQLPDGAGATPRWWRTGRAGPDRESAGGLGLAQRPLGQREFNVGGEVPCGLEVPRPNPQDNLCRMVQPEPALTHKCLERPEIGCGQDDSGGASPGPP